MTEHFLLIVGWILNLYGLLRWAMLFLLLMEVVICKDAGNPQAFLNKSLSLRFKIFKRSIRNPFYTGSVLLFIGACAVILFRISDMSKNQLPNLHWLRLISAIVIPFGIYKIYKYLGYKSTFIEHFKRFLKEEE